MNNRLSRWLLIFLTCMPSAGSTHAFAETLPKELIGQWQVQEVHTNTASGRTSQYAWNDPRLRWRIFNFKNKVVENNTYDFYDDCKKPSIRSIDTTFRDAMLRSIGGYDYPPHENANPVSDYRLITDAKKPVRVFSLSCGKDLWQGDLGVSYPELGKLAIRGAWMAFTSDDRLYLRWRDETVLLLNKITKDAPEKASFDCAKASNSTEREICSSRELSGFDRSISDAYMRLLNQTQDAGENEKIIADDQHKWIKKRNTCNSDKKCILSLMKFRLQFLVDQSRT